MLASDYLSLARARFRGVMAYAEFSKNDTPINQNH
jgi:hypothetical protein